MLWLALAPVLHLTGINNADQRMLGTRQAPELVERSDAFKTEDVLLVTCHGANYLLKLKAHNNFADCAAGCYLLVGITHFAKREHRSQSGF